MKMRRAISSSSFKTSYVKNGNENIDSLQYALEFKSNRRDSVPGQLLSHQVPEKMASPEFIKSQKGKTRLLFNGYSFTREKVTKASKILWRCTEWEPPRKCMGRCHTLNGVIVTDNKRYNHASNPANNET